MVDVPTLPPEGSAELLRQIFELWIEPELRERGDDRSASEVAQALVELPPDGGATVFLDQEAPLVAMARAARAIKKGEPVYENDIFALEGLKPGKVDLDAGWIAFAQFKGGYTIAFDFRRNRAKAARLLDLADQYLETAREALVAGRLGPAVDNCFSAAELAVVPQMLLIAVEPAGEDRHVERRRWWADWTRLGNAPSEYGKCLAELMKHRRAARYGDKALRVKPERVVRWIETTGKMISHSRDQAADL